MTLREELEQAKKGRMTEFNKFLREELTRAVELRGESTTGPYLVMVGTERFSRHVRAKDAFHRTWSKIVGNPAFQGKPWSVVPAPKAMKKKPDPKKVHVGDYVRVLASPDVGEVVEVINHSFAVVRWPNRPETSQHNVDYLAKAPEEEPSDD